MRECRWNINEIIWIVECSLVIGVVKIVMFISLSKGTFYPIQQYWDEQHLYIFLFFYQEWILTRISKSLWIDNFILEVVLFFLKKWRHYIYVFYKNIILVYILFGIICLNRLSAFSFIWQHKMTNQKIEEIFFYLREFAKKIVLKWLILKSRYLLNYLYRHTPNKYVANRRINICRKIMYN